jgi:hypothetical protein
MGPSEDYLRLAAQRMDLWDNLEAWEAELVDEYGLERALRVIRENFGKPKLCREILEAERQQNERLRWERYGGSLPVGL